MKKIYGLLICGTLGVSLLSGVLVNSSKKSVSVKDEIPSDLRLIKGASVQPKGSGTSADPYKIGTAEELEWLRNYINSQSKAANRNKCAILTSDIDLQGGSENQWVPIGYPDSRDFRGTFDGDGYTISGLYINDTSSRSSNSLFGQVRNGTVKNLTVRGEVTSSSESAAGIINYLYQGTADKCYSFVTVRTNGDTSAGGISAGAYKPKITNCVNYGSITSKGSAAGITAGTYDYGTISKCANFGAVTGDNRVGGIVGSTNTSDKINNCYNVGNVSNPGYQAGGIDGEATDGTIQCNHNVGTVTGKYKGAIIGAFHSFSSNVSKNYYKEGSCSSDAASSTMISAANYTTESSFDGFDFTNVWRMGPNYPVLRHTFSGGDGSESNPYIVKSVADLDHIKDDVTKHYKLGHDINYFGSETNLFTPIGTTAAPFTGSFDGDGYTVSNIYIKNTTSPGEPVGFFGSAAAGSVIKNFTLTGTVMNEDTTNNPNTNNTGGIVGFSEGKLFQCHNNAVVIGKYNVGGVVGRLGYQSTSYTAETFPTIEQCSNHSAIIAAEETAGGIVGRAYGLITNSFNDGNVSVADPLTSGHIYAGGIAGSLHGASGSETSRIEYCHSQGLITAYAYVGSLIGYQQSGNIVKCYYYESSCYVGNKGYNMNGAVGTSSGTQTAAGSVSLNDEQRNVPANYGDWDFNTIWMKGESYPVFYDAVKLVIMAINEIGTVDASSDCLTRINNAKALYNALSAEEKAQVTNYATLVEAEVKYVEALIDLIELGVFTDENKNKIDTAKAAYNSLSSSQKQSVDATKAALLENADKVYNAEKAISEIPYPFEYTEAFKTALDAAKTAYYGIDDEEIQEEVVNRQTLFDAEAFWKEHDDPVKAQEVKDLIDAIAPIEYTTECSGKISAARTAYDALNDEAKAIVGDQYLATLVSYEKEYDCMDKIAQIAPVTYTPACETKINAAREAYDALSDQEKAVISNYETLVSAEKIYPVEGNIEAIGTVEYTEECKARIDAARTSFDALSESEQNDVDNKQKLLDAEAAYKDLDDVAKANAAKELIEDIGEVVLDNPTKEAIEAAEAAYEALSPEAKALVGEELHEILVEARATYNSLVDNAAANEVIAKINAIGEVDGSEECKARISDARTSYDALTETQKGLVSNYETLLAAEKSYAEKNSGLAWWAILLIVVACLAVVCAVAYVLMFYVFHKWIKQNKEAIKVFKCGHKHGRVRLFTKSLKVTYRFDEEVFKTKDEALK